MSLQEVRDLVIIVAGAIGVLLLLAALIVTVVVGIAVRALIGAAQHLIREEVIPVVGSARETVEGVRGTSSFMTEMLVSPVIRLYGLFKGLRRFLAILGGVARRGRHEEEREQAE
jgi:hypothetical protein